MLNLVLACLSLTYRPILISKSSPNTPLRTWPTMSAAAPDLAVATKAAEVAAFEAEKYGAKGGNGGDLFGCEGVEPVIKATLDAAAGCAVTLAALEKAANAAKARTNANAARIADAVIVQAMLLGAKPDIRYHDITGAALYGTLSTFTQAPWEPQAEKA